MSKGKEGNKVSFDTMANMGITKQIAGREYKILPVNIEDMGYIIGDDPAQRLVILNRKQIENPDDKADWQVFGLNIIDPTRKAIFMKIINKYLYYKDEPMTEERLIEHGWSFREIGEFIITWCQESD